MKRTWTIRRLLPLLAVILLAAGLIYRHFTRLPLIWPGQSITLSVSDGETVTWKLVYQGDDVLDMLWKIGTAKATPVQSWTAPEEPWPVYSICVNGERTDFEAAICGGVWVDCKGRILATDLDFAALFDSFDEAEHTREGIGTISCRRELALRDGNWNTQFLVESSLGAPTPDVIMELTGEELDWTITNKGTRTLSHGNGGTASLQVLMDGKWYNVPSITWKHYAHTAEEYYLEPGASFSGQLWRDLYGDDLPAGNYRIVFGFDWYDPETEQYQSAGYSAAYFLILADGTFAQEGPVTA